MRCSQEEKESNAPVANMASAANRRVSYPIGPLAEGKVNGDHIANQNVHPDLRCMSRHME